MSRFVGTSGFAYREWRGGFYPADLPSSRMLSFYAAKLCAVEINSSFYRMPRMETLAKWASEVPESFRFAFKAPAVITHQRRLRDVGEVLRRFLEVTAVLGARRGPLLFQLPPWVRCDLPLLEDFAALLQDVPAAFEFRHPSWFRDDVYSILRHVRCALCVSDREADTEPPVVATAPFGYFRLRRDSYRETELQSWIELAQRQDWQQVYMFFRHEETGQGTAYARRVLEMWQGLPDPDS